MKISMEPTCPGHKRNQDSLNENQAVHLMRTLIYFIFPLYFISVPLDAANQQVFIECTLCADPRAQRSGEVSNWVWHWFGMWGVPASSSRTAWELVRNAEAQPHLGGPPHEKVWAQLPSIQGSVRAPQRFHADVRGRLGTTGLQSDRETGNKTEPGRAESSVSLIAQIPDKQAIAFKNKLGAFFLSLPSSPRSLCQTKEECGLSSQQLNEHTS